MLPELTSPIQSLAKSFSIDSDSVFLNIFIALGNAKKGRYHFVIFHDTTLDYDELMVLEDTEKRYSSDCIQYLIQSHEEKTIGSLFVVNSRKLNFDSNKCSIIDSDIEQNFAQSDTALGGACVFGDKEDTFLIIPENPNTNPYMVLP